MKPENLRRFWVGLATLIVSLLFWVRLTVQSTQLSYQIRDLEERIRKEQLRFSDLELQKDQYISLDSIEQAAKKKLGLVSPDNDDVIIIPVARS